MAQCLLTINIQWLLCTVIKFHVVKEAKEAVLYFVQDFEVNFDRGWQNYYTAGYRSNLQFIDS